MSKNILITGANRGIGLETVRQLAMLGHNVTLTSRDETKGLLAQKELAKKGLKVGFIKLDVTNKEMIKKAVLSFENDFGKLDALINNAAISPKSDTNILEPNEELVMHIMKTNAFSMLSTVAMFSPIMNKGGRIINFSSGLGSMTDSVNGWVPIYGCSKSLVNAITRQQAFTLKEKSIDVVAMCPGWVQTDMGGTEAPLHVSEGADTAVWLATTDTIETGKFYRDRKIIPW